MTNGTAIKLSILGFVALGSLALHQASRAATQPESAGKAGASVKR